MAPTPVQRSSKSGAAVSSLTFNNSGGSDTWVAPTANNLLVATVNGDNLVTTPSGWTAGPSVVDDNAGYMFWKVAAGTESTVTLTEGGSTDMMATLCEYSGLTGTPFDVSNSSTITVTEGTVTTNTSVTTNQPGDLVIAAACIYRFTATSSASAPSWTNSFVNQLSPTVSGTANRGAIFLAELVVGAAGTYATSASWTGSMTCRHQLMIGFKASAAASTPPILVMAPRR